MELNKDQKSKTFFLMKPIYLPTWINVPPVGSYQVCTVPTYASMFQILRYDH